MKLIDIYEDLSTVHFFGIVAIQIGVYCRVYNEDAYWMHKKWGFKIAEHKKKGNIEYTYTGFLARNKNLYAQRFKEEGLTYAIVGIKDYKPGISKPPFYRYVEFCSDPKLVGKDYGKTNTTIKDKITRSYLKKDALDEHNDFLQGILAGVNIATGEKLANDSIWSHPAIQDDIRFYLKSKFEN